MGNDYTTLDELRYYRNLLSLNVGDEIQWKIRPGTSSRTMIGTIAAIFPNGRGNFEGKQHAFMTVFSTRGQDGPHRNYSVSLTNPTITKLETDK